MALQLFTVMLGGRYLGGESSPAVIQGSSDSETLPLMVSCAPSEGTRQLSVYYLIFFHIFRETAQEGEIRQTLSLHVTPGGQQGPTCTSGAPARLCSLSVIWNQHIGWFRGGVAPGDSSVTVGTVQMCLNSRLSSQIVSLPSVQIL